MDDSLDAPIGEIITSVNKPLIEPGSYDMTAVKHHLGPNHFGSNGKYNGKLVIDFQIVEYGDAFETIVQRYYTVKLKQTKEGRASIAASINKTRNTINLESAGCHEC